MVEGPRRDDPARDVRYCSSCGETVSPAANYCTSCGAARDDVASEAAVRSDDPDGSSRLEDRRALEARVAAALESGWEAETDLGDRVVLVRRDLGGLGMHVVVALFSFWWTMGFGNAAYACYRYVAKAERTVVRADGATPAADGVEDASSGWSPLGVALRWFVGATFVALGASISTTALAVATVAFGVAIALSGVRRLPPVRRRLETRRPITTNGRRRTVSERSVTAADAPCSSCAGPVEHGVERTFRDATYVLGVPVSTNVSGRNVYCRACANGDVTRRTAVPTGAGIRRKENDRERPQRAAPETRDRGRCEDTAEDPAGDTTDDGANDADGEVDDATGEVDGADGGPSHDDDDGPSHDEGDSARREETAERVRWTEPDR